MHELSIFLASDAWIVNSLESFFEIFKTKNIGYKDVHTYF